MTNVNAPMFPALDPAFPGDPFHGAPWMRTVLAEVGVKEAPGVLRDNPRIVEYHKASNLGPRSQDFIPWCSSFANWSLAQHDIDGTGSKAARSWMLWGETLIKPRFGCITVISRGPNKRKGHVFFWTNQTRRFLYGVGGNQSDQVGAGHWGRWRILGHRWPRHLTS